MVDTITTLIEKAIQSDNDAEALACLRQVRKVYKGTGSAVMPRRVRRQEEVVVPATTTPMITVAEHQKKIDELERDRVRLLKDNQSLSSENTALKKQLLDGNLKADEDLLTETEKKLNGAFRRNLAAWTVSFGLAVILVLMVL